MLFDTGPEESAWRRNATRLRVDFAAIEHVHLSHWHPDHSGGMLEALHIITRAVQQQDRAPVVDVHPDRPDYRGMLTHTGTIVSLEADPTLAQIEAAGGLLRKEDAPHTVLDDFFLVSGAIPRRAAYETGIRGALRFVRSTGEWIPDESIADERMVVCHLRGKGLVVFTGCSHAGVISVCRHALELAGGGTTGKLPLYGVVGGFHLTDNRPDKLAASLADLKALGPRVLMPGHCTGWKFKFTVEQAMPAVLAPSFCGTTYTLSTDF